MQRQITAARGGRDRRLERAGKETAVKRCRFLRRIRIERAYAIEEHLPVWLQVKGGLRVREVRLGRGMSQEALSLESGLARSFVGEVETGRRNISLMNIYKLADALEVEAYELLQ